jgi:L-asparagine permease
LLRLANAGVLKRPSFRMPLAPYSGYTTLLFLAGVLVLMLFDHRSGPFVWGVLLIGTPALIVGWFLVRGRVQAAAALAETTPPEQTPAMAVQPDPDE